MSKINRYPTDEEAKQLIIEVGRRMYIKNFVAANDGNISCKVDDKTLWTTPTGVSKGFMSENELVKMNLDGKIISQGELKPSSEVKMHLKIYAAREDVAAVCHAHPPACTSFAIAGMSLDRPIYPEAMVNLGAVPCVPYELPGSQKLADSLAPYVQGHNAVLLANHGAVTWGASLMEAWYRMESAEHFAKILLYGKIIGRANELSREQIDALI